MDKLNTLAKLLWATGGVLCLMVFFYQATPILLYAMGAAWLQPLGICLMYTILFMVIAGALLSFAWLCSKLNDLQHFHETRRTYRKINILLHQQKLWKHNRQSNYRTRLEIYRQKRRPLWRYPRPDA
ncbi:MAG: hypothetical protein PVS3B3_39790 [Ktedonobacteraceae bacterium]